MATVYRRIIPELSVPNKPLGRNVHFDSRSALYPFRSEVPRSAITSQAWQRRIDVLNQGNLGSCTGNALVGCVGTSPLFEGLPADHVLLDENEAVKVYSLATTLDDAPGAYPPTDTGSDGIDACKAGVQLGLLSGYTHCIDLSTMELALQSGPVAIGINWYSSFDRPGSDGLVDIASSAYVRGGHEVEVLGIEPSLQLLYAVNSWGPSWGNHGLFHFSYATMERLLAEQGDCVVPVPVNVPAPVPIPPPGPAPAGPSAADIALDAVAGPWAQTRRYRADLKELQAAILQWEADSGH